MLKTNEVSTDNFQACFFPFCVSQWNTLATIVVKNNETNDKFYRKVAFPRYTESVKFMSQSRETALKLKPHRGLGTKS